MKKVVSILFVIFIFSISSFAQEIISDEDILGYEFYLGEEIEVQFDVNYLTDCDSYSIDVDIDYLYKEITITVDYNYDEDCDKTDDYETEEIDVLPLLEGEYDVIIECDVSFDSSLDEEVDLGKIEVLGPEDEDCDASFVPLIGGFCPFYGKEVCACNGQNYDNECEAYFEEEHGLYYHFTCGDFIKENSITFQCGKYSIDIDNTFETYNCSDNDFDGDELYFEYEHNGDSTIIYFTSSDSYTSLFLIDIFSGDLECLEQSYDSKLEIFNYSSGTYYIIVDGYDWSNSIEICDVNSNTEIPRSNMVTIFPMPTTSGFFIESESNIIQVSLRDIYGSLHFKHIYNNMLVKIDEKLIPGVYFAKIETKESTIVKNIIVK